MEIEDLNLCKVAPIVKPLILANDQDIKENVAERTGRKCWKIKYNLTNSNKIKMVEPQRNTTKHNDSRSRTESNFQSTCLLATG